MSLALRPLQIKTMNMVREAFLAGHRNVLLYGPTGFGKTELAIALMHATAENSKRAAIVLDRIVLCDQTSARLQKYDIDHGVLQSGHWRYRPDRRIQVCSAQTLEKRGSFPGLDLMIVDECHAQRKQTTEFIQSNQHIRTIGLSASPFTRGLGGVYSHVVSSTTTRELVEQGYLTGLKVFVAKGIDMAGAKIVAGEWSQKDASDRGIRITGDIVGEWVRKTHEIFGGPRKTIVFCSGVAHGEDLAHKFSDAGYNFVNISYRDDDQFKQDAIKDFSRPDTQIHGLIATDILTKGFDVPDVMIGVSARPFSKSFSSHVQQMGRVMRSHPGKEFAVWLDHSGNYLRFRDQWDDLYANGVSELDDGAEKQKKEPSQKEKEAAKCPSCGGLWPGKSNTCLHCGHVHVLRNDVLDMPGEMVALGAPVEKYDSAAKERWYQELLGLSRARNYQDGWAYWKYKRKFGTNPPWNKVALTPSAEVMGWVKHIEIADRRSMRSAA